MNAASSEPRWSRRGWFYAVGLALAVQVGLVLLLGLRPQPPPHLPTWRTSLHAAVDPGSLQQLAGSPSLQDPTLFALPSQHGFSGEAWLTFTPPEHRLTDWSEPPRWLNFDATRLGETFLSQALTATNAPLRIADKPLPRLAGLDLRVPTQPVPTQSVMVVEGDLAARPLLTSMILPSWTNAELLTNLVVQMAVDAEGLPISTVLLVESGSKEADQFALRLLAVARFAPLRRPASLPVLDPRLTWGQVVIRWHTSLPPVTNPAAAPP